MVMEAHSGAWSPVARKVLDWVADGVAATKIQPKEIASLIIAQRMSIAFHRENARAILKRAVAPAAPTAPSGWANFDDSIDETEI